jgi:hypothetical protein
MTGAPGREDFNGKIIRGFRESGGTTIPVIALERAA